MRRLPIVLFTFASMLAAADGDAIVRRHDRDDALFLAAGEKFPMVGLLGGRVSCTLIAPRWAITAAHAVEERQPFTVLEAQFGTSRVKVDAIVIHPKRRSGAVDSSADLALLRLAEPPAGIVPARLYSAEDEAGKIASIVGWGEAGTGLTGPVIARGQRRAATNRIEGSLENSLLTVFDAPPRGTELEGSTGPGDSGGALLIGEGTGAALAGVDSFNGGSVEEGTASRYGVFNAFARISTRLQWIHDTMASEAPATEWSAIEKTQVWPKEPFGDVASAFFQAFNSGRRAKVAEFIAEHRPASARSADERAAAWDELMTSYAPYEVYGFTRGPNGSYAVLAYSRTANRWRGVGFVLSRENPTIATSIDMWDAAAPQSGTPEDAR